LAHSGVEVIFKIGINFLISKQ